MSGPTLRNATILRPDGSAAERANAGDGFELRARAESLARIDELLEDLASLARDEQSAEPFYDRLLERALGETGAHIAAIWLGRERLVERLAALVLDWVGHDPGGIDRRMEPVNRAIVTGLPAKTRIEQSTKEGGHREMVSVVTPFFVDKTAGGVIELILPCAGQPTAQDRAEHLAEAFAELLGDHFRRRQLGFYRTREILWQSLAQFCDSIYRPGLQETAFALVNEGRRFIGCDRVSVIRSDLKKCRVLAVSGVDHVERRTRLLAGMEELAAAVIQSQEALWVTSASTSRPPQIEQPLQNHWEQSHADALAVLPLTRRMSRTDAQEDASADPRETEVVGAMLLEWFAPQRIDAQVRDRIEAATRHAANALSVALSNDRLPLIAVNRVLARVGWLARARELSPARWCGLMMAALLLALFFAPADFEVSAEGELQPALRRELFAPADALVDEVLVEHGDEVVAGQPLLRLRSAALDFEITRIHGEIQTAEKRLTAIRLARLDRNADQRGSAHRALDLTAEEEELKQLLTSLRRQEQLVNMQRGELEVRSPLPGRVLTWNVEGSLAGRPVERGQSLLTVGNVDGAWSLELRVPDEHVGYVLTATNEAGREKAGLRVSFLLAGEPSVVRQGEVTKIAGRSQADDTLGKPVVLVTVRPDDELSGCRPGAAALGKINCGRRSIGYVWFHDTWNSVRRRLLF